MIEKIKEIKDINKYIPRDIFNDTKVKPKYWELQNRKTFYQWLEDHFNKYNLGDREKTKINKEEIHPNNDRIIKQLAPIQKIVRDFMQGSSPYRGLLIYYGLGVGKTQTAISIANAIENKDEVIFMSKAALEPNFINSIKKGGVDYMVNNNYWIFCKKNNTNEFKKIVKEIGVSNKIIDKNSGIYLIDYTKKKSNYYNISSYEREELNKQINDIINNRFTFLHYDDTRLIKKLENKNYSFDNKVIIIDEVHNLINGMTKLNTATAKLYNMFMDAENSKFVFLSGTPIINKVFEAAKLFNILRGKIYYSEYKIKHLFTSDIDYRKIKQEILKNRQIDQVIINKINKTVKITFNPPNYLTSIDPDKKGIVYTPNSPLLKTYDELIKYVSNILNKLGYKFNQSQGYETALPNDEKEFEQYFYNPDLNKIKKKELFKKRIANLTSFYDYKDPELFPKINSKNIIKSPMSYYQLQIYSKLRNEEIQKDKKNKQKKEDEQKYSSYRLHSRLACSFVEPEDIPTITEFRMKGEKRSTTLQKLINEYGDDLDELDNKMIDYFFKKYVLNKLEKNKYKYFCNDALKYISPKYIDILNRLNNDEGLSLIYSYFITFKGLKTFSLAMEATDKWEEFKMTKINGQWELHKSMTKNNKHRYIFFSGQQSTEEKQILPIIFNSQYNILPNNCYKLKKQIMNLYGKNNLHGECIKALMTTRTGTEGLDLKNVRNVHITEPYWQPVLIQQVIGRAVRTNSHASLPLNERNVRIFIYMSTIPKNLYSSINQINVRQDIARYNDGLNMKGEIITSDEALYITSERKKTITDELLNMIKDTAFDCNLTYADNKRQHKDIVCMDYETKDRDEYLFTPNLDDTLDIINIKQDYYVTTKYTQFKYTGKTYYFNTDPTTDGQYFIYDDTVMTKTRTPKPIGKMILKNRKLLPAFYKKKNKTKKK